VHKATKVESGGVETGQPPKAKQVVDPGTDPVGRGQHSKLNCLEELTRVADEGQCSCHLMKTTTALTILHELAELPHLPIATNSVDRRNQILLTSQAPCGITSEFPLVHQY
jgi:hypothetical protein